jgi:general secretion pathway protein C
MTGLSMTARQAELSALATRIATHRWTPVAITLLALALLGHSLAQWTWRLLTPSVSTPPPASAPAVPVPDSAAALRDLLAANLFGVLAAGNGAFSPDALPSTSLNLVLTGVMVRGQGSYALIRIDGGDETPVTIGDEIQAGARLHAVYSDRAVLLRGNSYESLLLKDNAPALAPGSIQGGSTRATNSAGLVRHQGNQYTVNRESIQQQIQRPEFLSQALIVPNAGGGFLVREVQPGSLYEKLGVRVGDVIRSVNGQTVNNIDDVMKLYQSMGGLEQAGNIAVEISRAGRNERLQYQLD